MLINISVNNWGWKRLGHLGQQSPHFLAQQITMFYKHGDEPQQRFFENFVDYMYKRYKHLSACENISL